MNYLNFILLGLVQGITEFLPISSSAHLNLMQKILNLKHGVLYIDVALHFGTLCAIFVYFFKDIINLVRDSVLVKKIFIVSLITGSLALLLKDLIEQIFLSLNLIAVALFINGIMLFIVSRQHTNGQNKVSYPNAIFLGIIQTFALIPGISRSGITISTLLWRGVDRETAFKFSFLAAVPLIFAAFIFSLKDIRTLNLSLPIFSGVISAFISGIISLHLLKQILVKMKLYLFGYYCCFMAALIIIFMAAK